MKLIAGVDEVGRGPLAGDVVAAAVILPNGHTLSGLTDSKKLSEKKRSDLFTQIKKDALCYAIGRASVEEIDALNILHASLLAMERAVKALAIDPDFVKVDGNKLPNWQYKSEAIVGGDAKVDCISAASILAKVTRDSEMIALDTCYPGYGLAKHKGYPTKAHLQALAELGPSEIHRRSYAPVKKFL